MEWYLAQERSLRAHRHELLRGLRLLEGGHRQTRRLQSPEVPGEGTMVVGGLHHCLGVFMPAYPPRGAVLEEFPVASYLPEDPRLVCVALGRPAGILLPSVEAGVNHARHEPFPLLAVPGRSPAAPLRRLLCPSAPCRPRPGRRSRQRGGPSRPHPPGGIRCRWGPRPPSGGRGGSYLRRRPRR